MKQHILNSINDLFMDWLYYDRKEDEELKVEEIENAVENGIITKQEIIDEFMKHINENFE